MSEVFAYITSYDFIFTALYLSAPLKVKAVKTKENSLTTRSRREDSQFYIKIKAQSISQCRMIRRVNAPKDHADHLEINRTFSVRLDVDLR